MEFYAQDIMNTELITVKSNMTCSQVLELCIANRISGAPVVNSSGVLVGVVSVSDLVQSGGANLPYSRNYFEESMIDKMLSEEGFQLTSFEEDTVADMMTRDVFTAVPETPVADLANVMYQNRIHRVIVLKPNEQIPLGIVTTFDLLKLLAEKSSTLAQV